MDSAGARPSYNLRTLTRALQYCRQALPTYGMTRALYDGLSMSFLTQLHPDSMLTLEGILKRQILGSLRPKEMKVHACQLHG